MGKLPSINDQFIKKLTEITEANLADEQFGVTELAHEMGISRTALYRKVKLYTKKSVSKFISEIRLEKAVELLKQQSGNVSEVAYQVGFGSPSYFIKCFHDHFGYSPGEILIGNSPEDLNQSDSEKTKKRRLKIRSAIVLITVVAALIIFLIYQNNYKTKPAKTIAVISFVNESPNESLHILNGLREKIFTNLELIENIKLVARKTSGKYTGENYSINEIGKKLNANYILKGSSVTINGTTRIWLYLIETETGKTPLSRPYQREITIDNFFEIQNEIADLVTEKLDAVFTSNEKEQIAKIPTRNNAALNLYLQGLYNQNLYELNGEKEYYVKAKELYEKAIQLDSTFADAYCQLADIYISNLVWNFDYTNYNLYNLYLDSGIVMVNKAIDLKGYDFNKALQLKADYYQKKGEHTEALKYFEKLWRNKKKDYNYYLSKSDYYDYNDDYYNSIENTLFYLKLKPTTKLPDQNKLGKLVINLTSTGFPEIAKIYAEELYELHNDSINHFKLLARLNYRIGDFTAARKIYLKLHMLDSTNFSYLYNIMCTYIHQNNYSRAFEYTQLYDKTQIRLTGENQPTGFKGYLYQINGMEKEAMWNFNGSIINCRKQIKFNNPFSQQNWVYGLLSGNYAMQGYKKEAIENFKIMVNRKTVSLLLVIQVKVLPFYDNIREEPEFKKILKDLEFKYQKEHDRVEKLLIREGIIKQ